MKIFEDGSYVDIKLSKSPGKVEIILGATDSENPLKKIVNSAEIELKDFAQLVHDIGIPLPPIANNNA